MKVNVYSTQMGVKTVETEAELWGDLQKDLKKAGITFNKMKVVIGETKHTLEADSGVLPKNDFTLFLMPKKTKAGADVNSMSYKEIRAAIKDIIAKDEAKGKDHFNVGKNYTTKGTEELRGLLGEWLGVVVKPVEKKKKKATKTSKKNVSQKKKNKVEEPKRGFSQDKASNDVIKKATQATEEMPKATAADVVESVKESKEEEVFETQGSENTDFEAKDVEQIPGPDGSGHIGLDKLMKAMVILEDADINDLDRLLDEDIKSLAIRIEGKYLDAKKIHDSRVEEAKEAKIKAEKEAEEARLKKEEEDRVAAEKAEEARLAKEEKEAQAKLKEEEEAGYADQMRDMMGEFDDVKKY